MVSFASLAYSVFANLVIPLRSSKLDYANFRMIVLYANYAGFLHFGLLNGFYLAVVGKKLPLISWGFLSRTKSVLFLLQLVAIPLVMLVLHSLLPEEVDRVVILVSAFSWILANVITFYAYLLQGTNNFRTYTIVTLSSKLVGILVLSLLLITNNTSTRNLAVAFVIPLFLTVVVYEAYWLTLKKAKQRNEANAIRLQTIRAMWERGMILYFANIGITSIFMMGSVAASFFFEPEQFADFAFAYGFASVSYIAIDGLAIAAVPYLARNLGAGIKEDMSQAANLLLIWLAPIVYWVAKATIQVAYAQYQQSLSLILLFTATLPFTAVIRGRLAAGATASGNERFLLRFSTLGSIVMLLAIASSFYFGQTIQDLVLSWSLAIGFIGLAGGVIAGNRLPQPGLLSDRYLSINALSSSILLLFVASQIEGNALSLITYLVIAFLAIWFSWRHFRQLIGTEVDII